MRIVTCETKWRMTSSVLASSSGLMSSSDADLRIDGEARQRARRSLELHLEPGHVIVLGHRAVGLLGVDVRVDQRVREDPARMPVKREKSSSKNE